MAVAMMVIRLNSAMPPPNHAPSHAFGLPKYNWPVKYKIKSITVAPANTPSLDSHELRHWLRARQARSGCPRCHVEAIMPMPISLG